MLSGFVGGKKRRYHHGARLPPVHEAASLAPTSQSVSVMQMCAATQHVDRAIFIMFADIFYILVLVLRSIAGTAISID